MHQSFVSEEVDQFIADHDGRRPIEHLHHLGVLGPRLRLAHALAIDDAELELLRRSRTKVVHCVLGALKTGYGATAIGRYPEMIASGMPGSLGTDGPNCANSFDMTKAMYAVATIYKDRYRDVTQVSAERAIELATLGGADSILPADELGSLEPGKKADIVIFDAMRPEWLPLVNVVNNLVYSANGNSVETVVVDGCVVVEYGRCTTFDERELYERIAGIDWANRLQTRLGLPLNQRWPVL